MRQSRSRSTASMAALKRVHIRGSCGALEEGGDRHAVVKGCLPENNSFIQSFPEFSCIILLLLEMNW